MMCKVPKECTFCAKTNNRTDCPKCRWNPGYKDYFEVDPKVMATLELVQPQVKDAVKGQQK